MNAKQYRKVQLKQKKLKAEQKKLAEEKAKNEEEMLMIEGEYKNMQDEIDQKSKIIHKLRRKYKASLVEIDDLEKEHQEKNEQLTDTIRILERDSDFYRILVSMMLKEDQLY